MLLLLYAAVSKGEYVNLGNSMVRYGLHLYFAVRHGWYFQGLEFIHNCALNTSLASSFLKDWVPEYILDFFVND